MLVLKVSGFSCITQAEIEVRRLTILIGPQASGKSVISKLVYFCLRLLQTQFDSIEDGEAITQFQKRVVKEFKTWFPIEAWGGREFEITFGAGPYSVKIARESTAEQPDEVNVVFSQFFVQIFSKWTKEWAQTRSKLADKGSERDLSLSIFERFFRVRSTMDQELSNELKEDYVSNQLFIPAGRAFFTSMGKAVTAFEHVGLLDPITVTFGRLMTQIRESRRIGIPTRRRNADRQNTGSLMHKFFGGEIKLGREQEFVESPDGRRVPFSILSSGQQELLPLWLAIQFVVDAYPSNELLFVEEPEAHLFPASQSALTNYLVTLLREKESSRRRLFLTTHSPYVLANLNNLMKAGQIERMKLSATSVKKLDALVPKESRLYEGEVRAYALIEGTAKSIISTDKLISSDYLDEVSGHVVEDFAQLLELEMAIDT